MHELNARRDRGQEGADNAAPEPVRTEHREVRIVHPSGIWVEPGRGMRACTHGLGPVPGRSWGAWGPRTPRRPRRHIGDPGRPLGAGLRRLNSHAARAGSRPTVRRSGRNRLGLRLAQTSRRSSVEVGPITTLARSRRRWVLLDCHRESRKPRAVGFDNTRRKIVAGRAGRIRA